MNLGLEGRKAIVCASSRGLGRARQRGFGLGGRRRNGERWRRGLEPLAEPPQNFSPGSFDAPHAAHSAASVAPHSAQKRRSARLSWWQDGQRIGSLVALVTTTPRADGGRRKE
jgi:hypothetical protein